MRINPDLSSSENTAKPEAESREMSAIEKLELYETIADLRRMAGLESGAAIAEVRNSFAIFALFRGLLLQLNATAAHGNVVTVAPEFVEGAAKLSIEFIKHETDFHVQLVAGRGGSLDKIAGVL